MAKAVVLEEFHLTILAPSRLTDEEREEVRQIVVGREFRRDLRRSLDRLIASRPDLKDVVFRVGW